MNILKGNAMVGQSGGPTSAINASLAGVFKACRDSENIDKVYGLVQGMDGLLSDDLLDMNEKIKTDADLDLLCVTPAAYLGSCRFKLPSADVDATLYEKIFDAFKKHNIRYFFYIGGNDSMDTVHKLSDYAKVTGYDIRIMGVPKTIDNDLDITDHTPGYGSAAKFIATAVKEICCDAGVYAPKRVTVIEIMGRNAGWLTASSALAKGDDCDAPDLIYLPEITFDMNKFLDDVRKMSEKKGSVIVCVSEGCKLADGSYICEAMWSGETDVFGHKFLSGAARVLAQIINQKLGIQTRQLEFGSFQRCAARYSSKTDLDESRMIGEAAVKEALNGSSGKMMYYKRISDKPYKMVIESIDIGSIANVEKVIPRSWINEEGNYITQECIDYMLPLIQGEPEIPMENGLPKHLVR